jgi:hypothetical protein
MSGNGKPTSPPDDLVVTATGSVVKRGKGGRFTRVGPVTARRQAVPRVVKRERNRMLKSGLGVLWNENRGLAMALKRRADEMLGNIETTHPSYPELRAEVAEYVRGEMLIEAVDGFIVQLGDRIIDKRRRRLHQIMHDRKALSDSLSQQRQRISQLKQAVELESRVAALEEGRRLV